jgi:hypothetical protein
LFRGTAENTEQSGTHHALRVEYRHHSQLRLACSSPFLGWGESIALV